jgi:hypothetical protein
LFPDIDWPPVHSDSPSIHQYWAILDHRYRRLVLEGELGRVCTTEPEPTITVSPSQILVGQDWPVDVGGSLPADAQIEFSNEAHVLPSEIQQRSEGSIRTIVRADLPGSYDLVVRVGSEQAPIFIHEDALVVVANQEE